jgi:hypothetical protein
MKRQMGDLVVNQRTSDGMFNATSLATQFSKNSGVEKRVKDYLRLSSTKLHINNLIEKII